MAKAEPIKRLEVPAWTVRLAEDGDMAFVYDSWLKSAQRTYPNMFATEFFSDERAKVQRIIASSVLAVACTVMDRNDLLGHIVYGKWRNTLVLHYAFVKPDARRNGVLASMLAFANYESRPVVMTAAAQDPEVMKGLVKKYIFDRSVLPLMQRGDR